MKVKCIVMAVVAMAVLVAVPALAVDWVLDSAYSASDLSVPGGTAFSAALDMPTWATFTAGSAVPDVRVTYRLTFYDNFGQGNSGLALWLDSAPQMNSGLFGGLKSYMWNEQYAAVSNTANYTEMNPNSWIFHVVYFDVDLQVVTTGGVTSATVSLTNIDGGRANEIHTAAATYVATEADISNWAGNTKLANYNYSTYNWSGVSGIKFYQAAATPEPGSMFGLAAAMLSLGGFAIRRRR